MPNMPLLPKQPVVLYMGRELISKEGLELIRDGISEATKLESACMASTILGGNYHAQPVIPEQQQPIAYIFKHPAGRLFWSLTDESNKWQADVIPVYAEPHELKIPPAIEPDYEVIKGLLPTANPDEYACCVAADMWNACRAEMLKAQQNEPQNIPENIPAQPVIPEHSGDNLPCPFCGGEVDVSGWRSSNGNSGPECNECGATASNLSDWNKRTAQPVSEPYNLPVGYFSYGSECGFDWHKTEKEAIESAEAAIDDYRGDACDGWSEETDSVCWGVILQQATKVDERSRTDDDKCDPAIDTVCDYALLPAQESE